MTKRVTKRRDTTRSQAEVVPFEWVAESREAQPENTSSIEVMAQPGQEYRVKCVYHTRVVVEQGVPSGHRYDFQPGETQPVKAEDYYFLLDKKREQRGGCCGSSGPQAIPYFEEA